MIPNSEAGRLTASKLGGGSVTFYFNHPVAEDMAHDLIRCLPSSVDREISIYIGSHRFRKLLDTNFSIGLQTEHFLDENGNVMWGAFKPNRLRNAINRYDQILDFSVFNKQFYLANELNISTVTFGPFIFPSEPFAEIRGKGPLLFFGSTSSHRRKLLRYLERKRGLRVETYEGFGKDLEVKIQSSLAVANIHVDHGTYTEYPRALKSYLNGKVMFSESLGSPFVDGRHYLGIDSEINHDRIAEIFDAFTNEVAMEYPLRAYLKTLNLA